MSDNTIEARITSRRIANLIRRIEEHLEALQRDAHSPEFQPWKNEIDSVWKQIFEEISLMPESTQIVMLESIREPWTNYISHYTISGDES